MAVVIKVGETEAVSVDIGEKVYIQGDPGFSPTIEVTDITGGHRLTITDINGDKTVDVMNGAKGDTGATGNGIEYITLNADYTLTVHYTNGTSWTSESIRGEKGDKGDTGTSISGAVLNADYTLTLTFSDGSSYTTPPIRGAQGERGPIGPTPDISIGTVTTGAAGSQAKATMTGTPEQPVLNLTIPRGDPGEVTQAEFDELADEVADQKSAFEAHEQYAEETYAKQDGSYEDLTAGNAYELLSDRGDTNQQPYLFRQTGGDSSAYNREQLRKIVGGTVAFNQLCQAMRATSSEKGLMFTRDDDGSLTISGTITEEFSYNYVQFTTLMTLKREGTKYLFLLNKPIPYDWGLGGYSATIPANTSAGMWTNTAGSNWSNALVFRAMVGDTVDISGLKASVIDLTQMFGTAIADYIYSLEQATAGAGVAFFRSLFPADYYDYNPGELMSVEGVSAHETVGFNQWDEEWELGLITKETGRDQSSTVNIRSKNYIPVAPSTNYFYYFEGRPNWVSIVVYYDENKNWVGFPGTQGYCGNTILKTPDNCHYVRFYCGQSYGTTYNHDICINLSDPAKNGTYEPYKKRRTYPLDSSLTLRGIPKLDSNNRLYYDGDTYEPDGTVTRRYGIVDLGTLDWLWYSNVSRFAARISGGITGGNGYGRDTAINKIYPVNTITYNNMADKTMLFGSNFYSASTCGCVVRDDSFNGDAAAFKAAMSGVMLVYELATPTAETAEPYRELEICDRDGTEEFVSTSIVPVGHETFYPVNVFDYIDRLTEPDADMIADSAIAANKYFSVGNRLFLSTASIAAGAMIIPGTNCQETSLAAALNALNA